MTAAIVGWAHTPRQSTSTTCCSMHVQAARQVTGRAGGMQVPGARLAGMFNMGGTAAANYVSILEALR